MAAGGQKESPLLSWPVPSHQPRQLVVFFSSALGSWKGGDQSVQFRLAIGKGPFSVIDMYLLLNVCQEQSCGALPNPSSKQSLAAGIGIHDYRSHQALRWGVLSKNHVAYTRKRQIEMLILE